MFAINEGPLDRGLRVVVGSVLLWLAMVSGMLESPFDIFAIIVGVAALLTGISGRCGLYKVFGISTCGRKE